ncbi:ATP-binding cassette domain-containing protein [Hyphomicrobium sp. xq]|uniref:ATP-binding cassette domain-containing protein n=1 Tax=Hyphomicrobium album TaxID=2665159 RepID=A0A6I3KHV5_9HYPH|nr:metal ABC transporter ATP-binding protein [Hyphomicrobium album]MTD95285.1 ATP-binding cassette domain-containing protein [Hyphomicrobium album]
MAESDGVVQAAPKPCGHGPGHACTHAHVHDGEIPAFDPAALISARGVSVIRNGRDQLVNVNLDIHEREIVTLIGPNGAGKTTLVRVLLGLEKPDRGSVHRRRDLRIGYVPQRFDSDAVIPMTVERFLTLGSNESIDRIGSMLKSVDATSVRHQQLGELSGGELQRVVLARALLRRPNLLVLDEPVQGVDYSGEADLYNLIAKLRDEAGFGVLLVSHDLHFVMGRSDRVICLNRHVCCSGVPEAVAQHPAYGRLFGAEAARAFAVYRHHHDHSHDLAGHPHPAPASDEPPRGDR